MLLFDKISLYQADTCLLQDASVFLKAGWKIGLIGENGSGKSTLLGVIQNKLQISSGKFETSGNLIISAMHQEFDNTNISILQAVLSANAEFVYLQKEIERAQKNQDLIQLTTALEKFDNIDGWKQESQACELLRGLGFKDADFERKLKEFSGGWQIRVALAMALFKPADLLLLDEPNNHLDIAANLWLEKWLADYKGSLILISHDEYLLDNICNHILQIKNQNLLLHKGNYSGFIKKMQTQAEADMAQRKKLIAQKEHLQAFVDKFRYKATKAKQAQSRIKALEKMPLIPEVDKETSYSWEFLQPSNASSPLIRLDDATLGYANNLHNSQNVENAEKAENTQRSENLENTEKNTLSAIRVLQGVNLIIETGTRLGILGVNGAGKSTLVKTLAGDLEILSGKKSVSKKLKIGYFAQHQLDALNLNNNAFEHLQKLAQENEEFLTATQIRSFLGGFGFTGEKVLQKVETFSGGEKARLALGLLVWQKPNLLLLDEPTNHLDLKAKQALILSLQNYTGALVVISHQRSLLNSCVDDFVLVSDGKLSEFKQDLEDYQKLVLSSSKAENAPVSKKIKSTLNPQQKRALLAPLRQELGKIDAKVQQLQESLENINTSLADTDLYKDEKNLEKINQLTQEQQKLSTELDATEAIWLEKSTNLDFIIESLD